jgi:hypothetical protein
MKASIRRRWTRIDSAGGAPRILPGVAGVCQHFLKVGPAARDDVAADVQVLQWGIDFVVVCVAVGRLVVEHYDQVKVAVRPGAAFSAAAEEVDPEGLQDLRQPFDDCLERLLLRRGAPLAPKSRSRSWEEEAASRVQYTTSRLLGFAARPFPPISRKRSRTSGWTAVLSELLVPRRPEVANPGDERLRIDRLASHRSFQAGEDLGVQAPVMARGAVPERW